MINIDDVKEIVSSIGGYDDESILKYLSVIKNAVSCVQNMLKDDEYSNDTRVVFLAGIKACNDISLLNAGSSGVTSFKVGDISITESADAGGSFSDLYSSAIDTCRELLNISYDGFAFIDV